MIDGTTRADFVIRKNEILQNKDLPVEAVKLIEDLHDAFERGFMVAYHLKRTPGLEKIGEYLRLYLMNDKDRINELLPPIHDVHTRHCCIIHGCKYGEHDTCTVTTGRAKQEGPCEICGEENE